MGNPILDRDSVVDYTRVFYNWGLVDSQGALAVKSLQEKFDQAIKNGDSLDAYSVSIYRCYLNSKINNL